MSSEEYELDPELKKLDDSNQRIKEVVKHFAGEKLAASQPEVQPCTVDEAYLIRYEELKADLNLMEKTLEIMKAQILAARMPGEKTLSMGRAAVFFREVPGTNKVDWEALVEDVVGPIDNETLKKYTKPGREGYTQVTVRKL